MATEERHCPDDYLVEYARKLKAIGHPIRLRLLCLIAREVDPCVSDLWRCLDQPQPVISQHLAILKANGLVAAEVQKTKRVYTISDPFIKDLVKRIMKEKA
ncbi:MAG TPA: metalloregulator ArsR/SmtB family transcription factor [Spirochaetales bacterium]|nr:metalloregulator ArsR/SmtB family transcription factor [Spirochaetales bacterium]HRY53302.1 metalloregulator ArsR/SmtB family transcription factor [Spirochaetia bacterium]HRZ66126.1 metalloregulator ArsR/SmtB family transcription factor [Spirochaetia bacterium]